MTEEDLQNLYLNIKEAATMYGLNRDNLEISTIDICDEIKLTIKYIDYGFPNLGFSTAFNTHAINHEAILDLVRMIAEKVRDAKLPLIQWPGLPRPEKNGYGYLNQLNDAADEALPHIPNGVIQDINSALHQEMIEEFDPPQTKKPTPPQKPVILTKPVFIDESKPRKINLD